MKIAWPLASNASKEKLGQKQIKNIAEACLLGLSTYIQVSFIIKSHITAIMLLFVAINVLLQDYEFEYRPDSLLSSKCEYRK